jgi:hypothetical protein
LSSGRRQQSVMDPGGGWRWREDEEGRRRGRTMPPRPRTAGRRRHVRAEEDHRTRHYPHDDPPLKARRRGWGSKKGEGASCGCWTVKPTADFKCGVCVLFLVANIIWSGEL